MLSDSGFDYETVFHSMTWDEILEANAALDLLFEAQEKRRAQIRTEAKMKRVGRR